MKLFEKAELHPERILAVTDGGDEIRYQEMLDVSERCFRGLGHSLVFLLCANRPGSLLSYLGAMRSDAVPLLLDARMRPELLSGLLKIYQPAYCIAPEESAETLTAALPGGYHVRNRIRDSILVETGWEGPALFGDLKLLLTTSGSTGSPKLVRISKKNLDANTASIVGYLEINEKERPITTLPMHYSYGMSVINTHVACGATILLTEHTIPERAFWERLMGEGATSLSGVPYTFEMLDRMRVTNMELPALRTLTQAGGKLPEQLHKKYAQWCADTGRRFFVMYGQTEASPRMGYLPCDLALEKCGSMGIAIPGGKLLLEDENGAEILESGRTGELVYAGDNVSLGYASAREDLGRGDENRGVLRTGDMAYRDDDGFFFITGRKKRFIKLMGTRYNLDELERGIRKDFDLNSAACTGSDDSLHVFTGIGEAGTALEDRLIDVYGIPKKCIHLHELEQIPVMASGKTDYTALGRLCEE